MNVTSLYLLPKQEKTKKKAINKFVKYRNSTTAVSEVKLASGEKE